MKKKILIFSLCLVIPIVMGVGAYYGIEYFENRISNSTTNVNVTTSSLSASIDKIYDSVYVVENYVGNNLDSTGTGVVYKTDDFYGYVLTNEHVITGASKILLTDMNEIEVEAVLLGSDPFADLAVLQIPKKNVNLIAKLDTSGEIHLGDVVFTVGSPMGKEYYGTVTKGIISGVNRLVEVSLTGDYAGDWIMKVIQTDASINPGNSGGPLCNVNGEVIGINTLKYAETDIEGMGFAIPIEYAMVHVDTLEKGETIDRPLLGVSMIDLDNTYALYKALITVPSNVEKGVVIDNVIKDSPADDAGLKQGDIIYKIDNEELKSTAYLRYVLYKYEIGDEITISYYREGEEKSIKVLLDEKYE